MPESLLTSCGFNNPRTIDFLIPYFIWIARAQEQRISPCLPAPSCELERFRQIEKFALSFQKLWKFDNEAQCEVRDSKKGNYACNFGLNEAPVVFLRGTCNCDNEFEGENGLERRVSGINRILFELVPKWLARVY